jgi:chromosome segregation ATPase
MSTTMVEMQCWALVSVACLLGCTTLGCVSEATFVQERAQRDAYRQTVMERERQLSEVARRYAETVQQDALHRAQLAMAERAQGVLEAKLKQLAEYNTEMDRHLDRAQAELDALRTRNAGAPKSTSPKTRRAEADAEELALSQVELLRTLRQDSAARARTLAELAKTVQHLVDKGQLFLERGDDGVKIGQPRDLDITDPWKYR